MMDRCNLRYPGSACYAAAGRRWTRPRHPGRRRIVVDFLEVHGLKEACQQIRDAGRRLVVAAPRIFKPGEQRLWLYFCRLQPDALLVRSAGLLWQLRQYGGSGACSMTARRAYPCCTVIFAECRQPAQRATVARQWIEPPGVDA